MNIFLARQPIYNRDLEVIAYELLYRPGDDAESAGEIADPVLASSQVIINAFLDMEADKLIGDKRALINVTRKFIETQNLPTQLASRVVLEILETETIDRDFLETMNELHGRGFKYALDDFEFDKNWALLLPGAEMIKYDVMALGKEGTEKQLRVLEKFKAKLGKLDAKLLAEKVETHEEYEHYKAMGFDYFQGYFMSKPKLIKERGVPASRIVVLSLIGELNNVESEVGSLETLISRDARLSFKLLKLVNAPSFGLNNQIDTITDAIVRLGLDELRSWSTLLALSMNDGKPQELLITAMVRGRMCQLLAENLSVPDPSAYFTAGLFSMMDALMDMNIAEIVSAMPFSEELTLGIAEKKGPIGDILKTVVEYETGDWDSAASHPFSSNTLYDAYTEALQWANETSRCLVD